MENILKLLKNDNLWLHALLKKKTTTNNNNENNKINTCVKQ